MSYKLLGLIPALILFIEAHIIWWRSKDMGRLDKSDIDELAAVFVVAFWAIIIIEGIFWAFS